MSKGPGRVYKWNISLLQALLTGDGNKIKSHPNYEKYLV
jgi:hypothetical protein